MRLLRSCLFVSCALYICCTAHISHAAEFGPYPLKGIVDGEHIKVEIDGQVVAVRLLYVNVIDNLVHVVEDQKFEQSEKETLSLFLSNIKEVKLSVAADKLHPKQGEAVISAMVTYLSRVPQKNGERGPLYWDSLNKGLISLGYSPYYRKNGTAPRELHKDLTWCQDNAKRSRSNGWRTDPEWMRKQAELRQYPVPPHQDDGHVGIIRMTQEISKGIRESYESFDVPYKSLSISSASGSGQYLIDMDAVGVGGFTVADPPPETYFRIFIEEMEFYVSPDVRKKLFNGTLSRVVVYSSDGKVKDYRMVLIPSQKADYTRGEE